MFQKEDKIMLFSFQSHHQHPLSLHTCAYHTFSSDALIKRHHTCCFQFPPQSEVSLHNWGCTLALKAVPAVSRVSKTSKTRPVWGVQGKKKKFNKITNYLTKVWSFTSEIVRWISAQTRFSNLQVHLELTHLGRHWILTKNNFMCHNDFTCCPCLMY